MEQRAAWHNDSGIVGTDGMAAEDTAMYSRYFMLACILAVTVAALAFSGRDSGRGYWRRHCILRRFISWMYYPLPGAAGDRG